MHKIYKRDHIYLTDGQEGDKPALNLYLHSQPNRTILTIGEKEFNPAEATLEQREVYDMFVRTMDFVYDTERSYIDAGDIDKDAGHPIGGGITHLFSPDKEMKCGGVEVTNNFGHILIKDKLFCIAHVKAEFVSIIKNIGFNYQERTTINL